MKAETARTGDPPSQTSDRGSRETEALQDPLGYKKLQKDLEGADPTERAQIGAGWAVKNLWPLFVVVGLFAGFREYFGTANPLSWFGCRIDVSALETEVARTVQRQANANLGSGLTGEEVIEVRDVRLIKRDDQTYDAAITSFNRLMNSEFNESVTVTVTDFNENCEFIWRIQ